MTIDAGAFVEPALGQRCVGAHEQNIRAAGVDVVAHIEIERRIAAFIDAETVAVEDHHRVAIDTVELDRNAPAFAARGKFEIAPIPAHAHPGIGSSQWLAAVVVEILVVFERQIDRPIVRQIDGLAGFVVEIFAGHRGEFTRRGEGPVSAAAESEVLGTRAQLHEAMKVLPSAFV